jgi:hypothetical protein
VSEVSEEGRSRRDEDEQEEVTEEEEVEDEEGEEWKNAPTLLMPMSKRVREGIWVKAKNESSLKANVVELKSMEVRDVLFVRERTSCSLTLGGLINKKHVR